MHTRAFAPPGSVPAPPNRAASVAVLVLGIPSWQWGYYKYPPLFSWLLYVFFRCFGALGPYLLGQLCVALVLWLTWRLGQRMLEPPQAAQIGRAHV